MANAIIIALLIIVCIFSIKSYARKLSRGCCGAGGDGEKKIKIKDKNVANYPYCTKIAVEGMTCSHCKLRVENALNSHKGVWAEADLGKKSVLVRMKEKISNDELKAIITSKGYIVKETLKIS